MHDDVIAYTMSAMNFMISAMPRNDSSKIARIWQMQARIWMKLLNLEGKLLFSYNSQQYVMYNNQQYVVVVIGKIKLSQEKMTRV